MALVQALLIPAEPHPPGPGSGTRGRRPSAPSSPPPSPPPPPPPLAGALTSSSLDNMGSVSSLIAARSPYQERRCRAGAELGARLRRGPPTTGTACLGAGGSQESLVRNLTPPTKRQTTSTAAGSKALDRERGGNGNYTYLNEDYVGDWNDNHVTPVSPGSDCEEVKGQGLSGSNMGGPPPRLVPVSGKLERNMEKTVLRPTAFKPVIPRSRTSMQYLSPRHGASLSDSQSNLNLLSPGQREASPSCSDKRDSYGGGRHHGTSGQSCSLSDSGRNSMSSLPPYGNAGYGPASAEPPGGPQEPAKVAPANGHHHHGGHHGGGHHGGGHHGHHGHHGHSNSDSGRSSSSKSTGSGSLSGRGQPLSDSGSSGRSPGPADGYEGVVRDLEDKLKERELELQQLRENLDENEAAICQVYEEKQKRCELEMEELRQGCATRMQTASQKAQRAQQVLQLQVFQLQQEKKKLQEDFAQLLKEREQLEERCASYEHEKIQLGPRLEETKWEVCQKSGEISLLKQQLKEVQGELSQRVGEIVSLRGQMRELRGELTNTQALMQEAAAASRTRTLELEVCENELQRRKSEAELLREKVGRLEEESARLRDAVANPGPGPGGSRKCQVFPEGEERLLLAYDGDGSRLQMDRMRAELAFERRRAEEQAGGFEEERRVWQEEKDKVIQYQKQLQQNYVQMYRRNRELERLLREMSLELDHREEFDEQDEGSGNEINFDEIAATEI